MTASFLIHLAVADRSLGTRLEGLLRGRGHRVVLSTTADEACRRLSAESPDLIICRFASTSAGTDELCRSLVERLRAVGTRVLLLGTQAEAKDILEGLAAHVFEVHANSCDDELLAQRVEALLDGDRDGEGDAELDRRARVQTGPGRTRCRTEAMEAVGRLAGVVVHDFNNILMVVKGYSDVLESSFDAGDKRRQFIAEIIKATDRASDLCDQLMLVAGRNRGELGPVHLGRTLEELRPQLAQSAGAKVRLRVDCAPDVGTITGEPGLLKQMISGLCLNAFEAMPDGGQLTLGASRLDAGGSDNGLPTDAVVLEVRDTGTGMTQETMAHIFEPYFTTKAEHSGLGLTVACRIVKDFGGSIECSSMPGSGTTVSIHLKNSDTGDDTHART